MKQKQNHTEIQELRELVDIIEKIQTTHTEQDIKVELDVATRLYKLRSNLESYSKLSESIEVGDILVWKEGLKNRKYPKYDEPCIVVEKLNEPIINDAVGINSAYYKEVNDIKLGIIMPGNEFVTFYFDSKRFTKFENT